MRDNIFWNLLQLYSKHEKVLKTPLEDFTTEIFASILLKNKEILDSFVNEILGIEGNGFRLKTQERYIVDHGLDCVIDMVIFNETSLCFLENKVNSPEGSRQLERYKNVLYGFRGDKNVYLRYCTKYNDPKIVEEINFLQFRWSHIYQFLAQYKEDSVIASFLEFMRGMKMAGVGKFNVNDLFVMNHVYETIAKMDDVLNMMTPVFIEKFGVPYTYDFERLKQIPKNSRYTLEKRGAIPGDENETNSKIILGFDFYQGETEAYPVLSLSIVCNKKHAKYDAFVRSVKEYDHFTYDEDDGESYWAWYEKPLSDFLTAKDQQIAIKNWYLEKLEDLERFL